MEYRNQIIENLNNLIRVRGIILFQIINLAMSTEYKDLDNMFEVGEIFTFELSHFEDMNDVNIQKLVSLCKNTEATISTLMNLNNIQEEELDFETE
jgi:hypothetical protein